ncbi:MAG: helix-turn-helix domain-containing protein [bacterium]|nr:helix-turn-helix domain-containing protein [bacterium]
MSGTSDPKLPGARRPEALKPEARKADAQVPDARKPEAKLPEAKLPEARTPGAMIAEARRKRGLSADDLAERTKIPVTLLVALEADEYHRLSGPLYARSFLRSCAKELGLPVEDVLDLYNRHSGETVRAPGEPPQVPSAVRIKRVGLPWAKLAVGFAAVAGLAVLSFVLTRPGNDASDSQAAVASQPVARAAAGPSVRGNALPEVEPAVPVAAAADSLPTGRPGLGFADGMTWPLVVRLQLASPALVRARRDGDEFYADVAWPADGAHQPVPVGAIVAGSAYATPTGFVIYWGAVGRLSLVLGAAEGVELTVNGEPRRVDLPLDGGELILDLEAAASPLP